MEPSATIYAPRRGGFRRYVPFVLAGVCVLSGGALLGNHLGQQAAARSVAATDWQPEPEVVSSLLGKTALLRGSFEDLREDAKVVQDRITSDSVSPTAKDQDRIGSRQVVTIEKSAAKDQDRIAAAKIVIKAPSKSDARARKNDVLAGLIPAAPDVDTLLERSATSVKSSLNLGKPAVFLNDPPLAVGSTSGVGTLPGEIEGSEAGGSTQASLPGYVGLDKPQPLRRSVPSGRKIVTMFKRAKVAKVALVKRRKVQYAEQTCMAKAIYFEARSEPTLGQMAVAGVVLNRVKHGNYPGTVCGVVFQNQHKRNACQFSFACDGKTDIASNKKLWRSAMTMAKAFITGKKKAHVIRTATHYHADYVSPHWSKKMRKVKKIGRHIFYYPERRVASRRVSKRTRIKSKAKRNLARVTKRNVARVRTNTRIEPASSFR